MDIIDVEELASYLRDDTLDGDDIELIVELANGIVTETIGEQAGDWTPTATIRAVTLEVAARAYRNPDGYASEQIDDYKYSRPSKTRDAGIYLTDEEISRLLGTGTTRVRVGWLA